MATRGELTVGKLRHFLRAFSDDTIVKLGQVDSSDTLECHANTYYPPDQEEKWPMIVIDPNCGCRQLD